MIVKIGDEYLELDNEIDVERQVKLFEELSSADGDFSYDFEAPPTAHNLKLLGFPFPDTANKTIYQGIDCQLLNDSGNLLYVGFLRVESVKKQIQLSFFSGNNNWLRLITGPLSDIDLSDLDLDQTEANITSYITATEGIVFPVVDNGILVTRGYNQLKLEDFVAGIYVKTLFKRIFTHHGIKIEGELLNDPTYNALTTIKNGKSRDQIEANSCYVQKTSTTSMPLELTKYKVTFDNDSVYPYYNRSNKIFDLVNSKVVAPVKMRIDIEVILKYSQANFANRIYIYINGAWTFVDIGLAFGLGGLYNVGLSTGDTVTLNRTFVLEKGDELEVYAEWQESGGAPPPQSNVISGTLKITPVYIFAVYGSSVVPNWTQEKYVSNIIRLFNPIVKYNAFTKTITFNLFDKVKSKEILDLSEYISNTEFDFKDFISNYGKSNTFSYNEVDFDDLRDYNIQTFFKYGQGSIESENDFLPNSVPVVESDLSNPIGYINPIFDMSIERLNLISAQVSDSVDCTGVTNSAGIARFAIPSNKFQVGDLVRLSESNNPIYVNDWIVETVGSGWVEFYGLLFNDNGVMKMEKVTIEYNDTDDVYLLWHIPNYAITNFSGKSNIKLEGTDLSTWSLGYFNLLNTGRQINDDYKQSLSFGEISSDRFYQRTMIETYWGTFGRILRDPVKLLCIANIPYSVFLQMDFLRPIILKNEVTTNLYYQNKITGYKGSEKECRIELIKLP